MPVPHNPGFCFQIIGQFKIILQDDLGIARVSKVYEGAGLIETSFPGIGAFRGFKDNFIETLGSLHIFFLLKQADGNIESCLRQAAALRKKMDKSLILDPGGIIVFIPEKSLGIVILQV